MALKVTEEQLSRWKQSLNSAKDKIAKYKEKADLIIQKAVETVEIGAASFGMGVLMGKTGGVSVVGVPVDLLAGLGLNLLGYVGVGGKYVDHLHNLGNGSLAHYLGAVGNKVGQNWGKPVGQQGALPTTGVKGSLGGAGNVGAGISDAELASLIHAT